MKFLIYILSFLLPVSLFAVDQIKVVGSGTVYPLSTLIAENFVAKNPQFSAPIVEKNGTGGGFKMFCSGGGLDTPDISNASRKISASEVADCNKNGVKNILEIQLGYDSIVMIQPKSLEQMNLTSEEIFLALAAKVPSSTGSLINNPYKNWSDVDKSLPNIPIKVMGPSPLSGTRDSFIELAMDKGSKALQAQGKMKGTKEELEQVSKILRTDGAYINGGEDYVLFINKVAASKDTLAILGYSFYEQNEKKVNAIKIDGVAPNAQSFAKKEYPLFRPLFVYVKADKIGVVKGLKELVQETISKDAIGPNGYLKRNGLIPMSTAEYNAMVGKIKL
ncbi:MAG: substrate-binding domain-containing protein [Alphaproteobacteria bacterium]|jgi:phosphate transport system substrate-binding protein|nr:substrate-binding domain-containing protein [Alphaproteobacteria bacterium]